MNEPIQPDPYDLVLLDLRRRREVIQNAINVVEAARPVCVVDLTNAPTLRQMSFDSHYKVPAP